MIINAILYCLLPLLVYSELHKATLGDTLSLKCKMSTTNKRALFVIHAPFNKYDGYAVVRGGDIQSRHVEYGPVVPDYTSVSYYHTINIGNISINDSGSYWCYQQTRAKNLAIKNEHVVLVFNSSVGQYNYTVNASLPTSIKCGIGLGHVAEQYLRTRFVIKYNKKIFHPITAMYNELDSFVVLPNVKKNGIYKCGITNHFNSSKILVYSIISLNVH